MPQGLIGAIVASNRTRKDHVADEVPSASTSRVLPARVAPRVGRLSTHDEERLGQPCEAPSGHHEAREGQGRARGGLRATLDAGDFFGSEVTQMTCDFKSRCDVIVANRWSDELADVSAKVYTRDLFRRD